jgi:hypothetical protein
MNLKYQLAFLFVDFRFLRSSRNGIKTNKSKKTQPNLINTTPTIMTKIVATEEVKKDIFPELKSASPSLTGIKVMICIVNKSPA